MATEGTASNPLPANTSVVEPKVKYGALAAYVLSALVLFLVELLTGNGNELIIEALPDGIEALVLPFVPALASLIAGYAARHQYRSPEVRGSGPLR